MVLPSGVAAIYTGGFASPSGIALLRQIRDVSPAARFHWEITCRRTSHPYALRASLNTQIRALAMNAELIQEHQYATQPLTPNDRSSLTQLRATPV
jgi:hypothetical protein